MVKFIKIIILPIDNYKRLKNISLYEKFINDIKYL